MPLSNATPRASFHEFEARTCTTGVVRVWGIYFKKSVPVVYHEKRASPFAVNVLRCKYYRMS